MPSGRRCSKLLLWMGFNDGFLFDFPIVIGEYFGMGLLSIDGLFNNPLKVLAHRLDKRFVIGEY